MLEREKPDGIIISIESYRFGALAGLFCPRSGCDFDCEFECPGVCEEAAVGRGGACRFLLLETKS